MVQSVDRALAILELLANGAGEMGVTELGDRLGVHKSTAFRLVATLMEHGLVEQNPATSKYLLSSGLLRLAGAVAAPQNLVRLARPVLQALAEETGETVNLSVREDDQVVSIDQITAPRLVVNVDWVGKQTPLHATSTGKVFLAHLSHEELEGVLARPLERLTPRTVVRPEELRQQLARVRREGYAYTIGELELGLSAVAAPARSADGQVVAAVSVAGPSFRVTEESIPELAESTMRAAARISRRMGYLGRREP